MFSSYFVFRNFAQPSMEPKTLQNIAFIGAGNVASHLIPAFISSGKQVVQVVTRSLSTAERIRKEHQVEVVTRISELTPLTDIIILSVPDGAVHDILGNLDIDNRLLVHTSGSLPMDVLFSATRNHGVFYPLQTFSVERAVNMREVPVCLETNQEKYRDLLYGLACSVSEDVRWLTSKERKIAHLAAVFASNFTNHMFMIAGQILSKYDLPFDLLKPLIEETAAKVQEHHPHKAQTGPARRNDRETIQQHLDLLKNNPELHNLYQRISEDILRLYGKGKE